MPHTLAYIPEEGYIELTVDGRFNLARLKQIAPEVASLSNESGCLHILNDMSYATIDVSVLDVYSSPQQMDDAGITRSTKRALVVPKSFEHAHFLETVTRNRGHDLKVFFDRDEAINWLQSHQP
jgi:hypothetical protein